MCLFARMVFQSLSRDSVCLDSNSWAWTLPWPPFQSLSRDSVCLDREIVENIRDGITKFQSLSRDSVCLDSMVSWYSSQSAQFQSLSRDSVCLDSTWMLGTGSCSMVSIPESGFCLFGLHVGYMLLLLLFCFNP